MVAAFSLAHSLKANVDTPARLGGERGKIKALHGQVHGCYYNLVCILLFITVLFIPTVT